MLGGVQSPIVTKSLGGGSAALRCGVHSVADGSSGTELKILLASNILEVMGRKFESVSTGYGGSESRINFSVIT